MRTVNNLMSHCNLCGGDRRHSILLAHVTQIEVADSPVYEMHHYKVLKCGGCETVSLKDTSRFSEDDSSTVRYYPPHQPRARPEWLWRLRWAMGEGGAYMGELLSQIYSALAVEAYAVAAMGVRALLEFVMVSKVGDYGTFGHNMDEFEVAGYVSRREKERLLKTLDVGSAAIHRGFLPAKEDALVLIDIAEHLVKSLYIHDEAIEGVALNLPPRKKPLKKPKAVKTPEKIGLQDQNA